MDVNVTPTANTPGISTSGHNHNHSDHYLHSDTYIVGQQAENSRSLLGFLMAELKNNAVAVERNAGDVRTLEKTIELESLKSRQEISNFRAELKAEKVAELEHQRTRALIRAASPAV